VSGFPVSADGPIRSARRSWSPTILMCGLFVVGVSSGVARAQISPGELSSAHADLEGSGKCLRCHEAGKGVASDRCLECHRILGLRIAADVGLHARSDYKRCERCHVEHHGKDFELVWWGEEGETAFDHRTAGYTLEGAHSRLQCRDCHKSSLVRERPDLADQGKDLSRTFLGLEKQNCLSCHQDAHEKQFPAESCQSCHSLERWKPVDGFDHDRAKFVLTGRHVQVACVECHAPGSAPGADIAVSQLRFTGLAYGSCTDCHRDAHVGRLGGSCRTCHTATSWKEVDRSRLDHDRTRFALVGKHRRVQCDECHRPGSSISVLRFGKCVDCHQDSHLGQLSDPMGGIECESCHTVDGFVPVLYPLERHQESDFPLQGAHLAVPCDSCHRQVTAATLAAQWPNRGSRRGVPDSAEVAQFRFASQTCLDCHEDPHLGGVSRPPDQQQECASCHGVESWRVVDFDHRTTDFLLVGRHSKVACRGCHGQPGDLVGAQSVRFESGSEECQDCHRDPHFSQFHIAQTGTACGRCHTADGWRKMLFDHDRDSTYRLEGGHSRIPCGGCHRSQVRDGQTFVQYKQIPTACEACHVTGVAASALTTDS